MNKIQAVIVADSVDTRGNRITSFLLTYPRFIHSELMTHRMFSRNSASSRAIPFEKMVKMVEEDPFIPIAWQKDHKGMQGSEYFTDAENIEACINKWLEARDCAIEKAKELNEDLGYGGVTKQLCNRLLEPFMWHTTLVTATELNGFFELRCPKYTFGSKTDNPKSWRSKKDAIKDFPDWITSNDLFWYSMNESQAEIHIQALAESMWDALNESTPKELKAGEFHTPFGDKIDVKELLKLIDNVLPASSSWYINNIEVLKNQVAVARCARLSYATHDGEIDYEKDIALHNQLLASHHMSPFENVARVATDEEYYTHMKGKVPFGGIDKGYGIINYEYYPLAFENTDETFGMPPGENKDNGNVYGWFNNFRGFITYRYLIENEKI